MCSKMRSASPDRTRTVSKLRGGDIERYLREAALSRTRTLDRGECWGERGLLGEARGEREERGDTGISTLGR